MTNGNSKFMSGCREIADYIGETPRRTFTLLVEKKIPAWKEGKLWRANKESLDRHYEQLEQNTFRSINTDGKSDFSARNGAHNSKRSGAKMTIEEGQP